MRDLHLEQYVSSDLRNDGEEISILQRNVASAILIRTIRDIEIIGTERYTGIAHGDYYLVDDALRFIESSLCVLCCEVAGVDYKAFALKCLKVFAHHSKGSKRLTINQLAEI